MSFSTFFAKNLSTHEHAKEAELRPHYYANDYETIKLRVREAAAQLKYTVVDINDDYHELFLEKRGVCDLIVTVIRNGVAGNRIDIKVNINTGISFGGAKKAIKEFYSVVDPKLYRRDNR